MTYEELKVFLEGHREEFLLPLSVENIEDRIAQYEKEFEVTLPPDFRRYLGDFQCLMLWGIVFSGITRAPTVEPSLEALTHELRNSGLRKEMIPLLLDENEVFFMDFRTEEVYVCHPLDVAVPSQYMPFASGFPDFLFLYLTPFCDQSKE